MDKYYPKCKSFIYYITEEDESGKFGDFIDTLETIITYSNEFREDNDGDKTL